MARYIDADALKDFPIRIDHYDQKNGNEHFVYGIETVIEYVDHLPTADVVEVRHGRWIEHYAFECWHYDCPFCDDGYATKERDNTPPNYCQNCGAKMDGKERE